MPLLSKVEKMIKDAEDGIRVLYPEDIKTLTGFKPRELQATMQADMRRFNSWCVHRRFGKSKLATHIILERAIECPFTEGNYGYVAPTFDQVERIAWKYIRDYVDRIPRAKTWDSDMLARIPTRLGGWAEIGLYGVDSPKQRLRGSYFDGVVVDEWQDVPPHVWFEQIRPMLADDVRAGVDGNFNSNQWAAFLFTPKGRNHAYRMHLRAERWFKGLGAKVEVAEGEAERIVFRNNWSAHLYPASVTGILTPEELEDARSSMDEATYMQEFECSFDAAVKGAIYAKIIAEMRATKRITEVKYTTMLPVHTAWDLGYDDATAIWFFQISDGMPRVIDYYENAQQGLDYYADILANRGYRYGKHYFPHDIQVHDLGTGKTRASVLKQLGIKPTAVPKVPLEDGIAAVRALLPRCYFDEDTCADGLDRLALYRRDYDQLTSTFRQKPKHDWTSHGADAFRTLALGIRLAPQGLNEYATHAEF